MPIFLVGLLSIVAQVILLRELSAAFYGADLIYLLALGAWLLWASAGAVLGRVRRAETRPPTATHVGAVLVAVGLAIPLGVAFIRRLRILLGAVPGAYLDLPEQIAASVLCLLPASLLLGLLFQWTAKRYLAADTQDLSRAAVLGDRAVVRGVPQEVRARCGPSADGPDSHGAHRSLARVYAVESLGAVAGGLAITVALHAHVSSLALALGTSALAFSGALFIGRTGSRTGLERARSDVALQPRRSLSRAIRFLAFAGLLACAVAGSNATVLDRRMTAWNHPGLVDGFDSPYGRVVVTEQAGQVTAYENDALVFDSESTAAEELAHLSLLQHPAPRRALVVGGVEAGLLGVVAAHGVSHIDDVEMDQATLERLASDLPPAFRASLSLPSIRVRYGDARRATILDDTSYDVIVVAGVEPASAQANRLFTREFFAQCATRLRQGGVLSLRLPSLENAWTPPLIVRTASIWAALRAVFTDVVVLPGSSNIVLASRGAPLARDASVLGERLTDRGIRARLVTPRYIRYLYSNDRFVEIERLLAGAGARPNTDADPVAYQASTLLWLSKFVPAAGRHDLTWVSQVYGWRAPRSWLLLAVLGAVAALWRWRRWPRAALRVGLAAWAGMVLESMLLLQYQLKQGVVFQDLGLLLMSVMAGLGAGAWVVDWEVSAGSKSGRSHVARVLGPARVLPALVLLAIGASVAAATGQASGLPSISAMLFATGAIVGAVFASAAAGGGAPLVARDQVRLVSPLYGADVLGGCLGSLTASLVLIPLLGVPATAQWAAALAAVALLLS